VYEAMHAGDADAVWVMQGWLFYNDARYWKAPQLEAYLSGVPPGRLVILDLFSEVHPVWKRADLPRPTAIEQRPWVWNMLHSFGGNSGLYGRMHVISSEPVVAHREVGAAPRRAARVCCSASVGARAHAVRWQSKAMAGVGITTEGIEQNPAVYELMAEMRWHEAPINHSAWLERWAERRMGARAAATAPRRVAAARRAWGILGQGVYACATTQMGQPKSMIELRPRMDLHAGFARLSVRPNRQSKG
jgi:alpha-N-acetylglucosaminidase